MTSSRLVTWATLALDGRVAVHDVLADTDEVTILPGSAGILDEIATMLAGHPELSLMIEGQTDSTGDFDHSMDLSQRRAAAVKQWLVDRHGIDAAHLRTLGLSSTQPQTTNDTAEGRARNRRVELVRVP